MKNLLMDKNRQKTLSESTFILEPQVLVNILQCVKQNGQAWFLDQLIAIKMLRRWSYDFHNRLCYETIPPHSRLG